MIINRTLARGASTRIPLPQEHVEWVRRVSQERLESIIDRGYSLHGDHTLLVPRADVGRPVPNIDGTEIADAAIATLASFAVAQFNANRKQAPRATALVSSSSAVASRAAKLARDLRDSLWARLHGQSARVPSVAPDDARTNHHDVELDHAQ
jgi:hypothetical protein